MSLDLLTHPFLTCSEALAFEKALLGGDEEATPEKAKDYWALPEVVAVGGSWLVAGNLVSEGRFNEVTRLAKEALDLAQEA